jgi:Tfp pilus assembly protein PilN
MRAGEPDSALPLLFGVIEQVPPAMYLTDYNYDAVQKSVSVKGRSADYSKVSKFASGLSNHPLLRQVRAEKASLIQAGERSLVEFSIEAKVR